MKRSDWFKTEKPVSNDGFVCPKIRPRRIWNAMTSDPLAHSQRPVKHVFCTYSDIVFNARSLPPGTLRVVFGLQHIQKKDIISGERDIKANFFVGIDGNIYEGRGWIHMTTLPPNLQALENDSITIAFMGDFREHGPTDDLFNLRDQIIKCGVHGRYIQPKFNLWQIPAPSHWQYKEFNFEKFYTLTY